MTIMIIMFVCSSTALSLEISSSNSSSSNDLNTVDSQTLAKKINDLWGGSEKKSSALNRKVILWNVK